MKTKVCLAVMLVWGVSTIVAQNVIDFEELSLEPESSWNGSDLNGSFTSKYFTFYNVFDPDWSYWEGFAYTNETDNTTYDWENMYSSAAGGGALGSDNYAVIYNGGFYDAAGISIDRNTAPEIISGMYLSLNTYASLYMDDFDYYVDGQHWFKVIITAINYDLDFAPQKEIILADYRFNSLQGYKFDEWQYIDLTWIGEADSLYFEFQSSDIGDWGINTPTYFCLDEINSNVPNEIPIFETEISESIEIAYGETADLLAIAKGGVQPYSYYWDNESTLDDSYLQNPIASPENTTLYSVTVSDAIGNNEVLTVEVIVNPTGSQEYNRNITTVFNDLYGNVNVECSETMSEIQIYDINGRLVKKVKPNNTRFGFNTTDLSNAMYFLRIQHSAGVELQKFIVNNQ
jgi:hypothetical protein